MSKYPPHRRPTDQQAKKVYDPDNFEHYTETESYKHYCEIVARAIPRTEQVTLRTIKSNLGELLIERLILDAIETLIAEGRVETFGVCPTRYQRAVSVKRKPIPKVNYNRSQVITKCKKTSPFTIE